MLGIVVREIVWGMLGSWGEVEVCVGLRGWGEENRLGRFGFFNLIEVVL